MFDHGHAFYRWPEHKGFSKQSTKDIKLGWFLFRKQDDSPWCLDIKAEQGRVLRIRRHKNPMFPLTQFCDFFT